MLLERLEMENFKSFRGRHEVVFGPRLNCITGPNGSEAICFAFGESSCARLRVATMKELHSKHRKPGGGALHAQETTTRVTLHLRTRQNEPMVLCATLCARTGHRTYKLNNRITSMKLVKRHLRLQCGINVDISLWLIQQNFVHKMPSRTPVELAGYLCEAGGTKLFFEYREEAHAAMENFKHSVQTIHQNIKHLTEVVQRETSIVEAYRKHSENDRDIKALNVKRKQLGRQIVISKLHRDREKLNNLRAEETEAASKLESSKSALKRLHQTAEELQRSIVEAKQVQQDLDAVQLELVRIGTEQEEQTSRIQQLQHQLRSNSQKQHLWRQELEESAKQMTQTETSLCRSNASAASKQSIFQLVSTAKKENHTFSFVVDEITRRLREVEEEDITQTAAKLRHNLNELRRQQSRADSIRDKAMEDAAVVTRQVCEAQNVIGQLREKTNGWTEDRVESEMNSLQRQLEAREEELRRIYVHLPKCQVPLQGEGDFGLFMDHLRMHEHMDTTSEWMGALGLLVSKSLANRICSDKEVARKILAANENRHSFTVWPVRDLKLQPRKADRHLRDILKVHGSKNVVDPIDLISVSQAAPPDVAASILLCLRKALGSWLLVKNDDIGREILHKYGIPSVSINLNMHSPGMLSGGYRQPDPTFLAFTQLRVVEAQRAEIESNVSSLAGIRSDLESLSKAQRNLSYLEAKLHRHQLEIERIKMGTRDLELHREQLEREQTTLRDASIRKRVFEEDMKAYLKAMQDHGKIVDATESTCFSHNLTIQQDDIRELSKQLTELEIAHSSLQTRVDQLDGETKQIEDEIAQLSVGVQSLNEAEAVGKNQENSLAQKLGQFAQHSDRYKSTVESIHQMSEQIRKLDAFLEQVVKRKRALREDIDATESELDGYSTELDACKTGSYLKLEELQEDLRQLDEQREALTLKQKVLEAELSSDPLIEETVLFKQRQLARFQEQHQNLKIAIQNLEDGIRSTQERSARANDVAFGRVHRCLQDIFSRVVPSKQVELRKLGESIEAGVSFGVREMSDSSHGRFDTGTKELSGGQLAMLGMAYVFALARFSASPLYILDEIDAALDEHNQRVVVELVLEYFDRSQVICISHHEAFHAKASQIIEVQKLETTSKITTRKPRS